MNTWALIIVAGLLMKMGALITGSENALIQKYSGGNETYLNDEQFNQLLNNIFSCCRNQSRTESRIDRGFTNSSINTSGTKKGILSADDIFHWWKIEDKKLNSSLLQDTCPLILNELDSCSCNNEDNQVEHADLEEKKPSALEVWGLSFILITAINSLSLLGAVCLPKKERTIYNYMMMVMVGLAVGSLSASAVFHLIPQAFNLPNSDSDHKYLNVALMVWIGIWVFFMVERMLSLVKHHLETKDHRPERHLRSTSAGAVSHLSSPTELIGGAGDIGSEDQDSQHTQQPGLQNSCERRLNEHHIHFEPGNASVATIAWMVIFGDGFHNFIDGLSIGAAFSESMLTGISISVAVMCEELPHELGDFAVLRNAGMSTREAILYNSLSALTCYLGMILGILLGEFEASTFIFGFAGGMFLYISLVDMMSELNGAAADALKLGVKRYLKILGLQNLGMFVGAAVLYILARYQDSITFN